MIVWNRMSLRWPKVHLNLVIELPICPSKLHRFKINPQTNDVQFQFRNWNWNRIWAFFSAHGIGIGIELRYKIIGRNWIGIELKAKISCRNWNRNWIEPLWNWNWNRSIPALKLKLQNLHFDPREYHQTVECKSVHLVHGDVRSMLSRLWDSVNTNFPEMCSSGSHRCENMLLTHPCTKCGIIALAVIVLITYSMIYL